MQPVSGEQVIILHFPALGIVTLAWSEQNVFLEVIG